MDRRQRCCAARASRARADITLGSDPLVVLTSGVRPDQLAAIEGLQSAANQSQARVVRTLLDLGLYVLQGPGEAAP